MTDNDQNHGAKPTETSGITKLTSKPEKGAPSVSIQLAALLWKNLWIQRIKRHYITTSLEIILISGCLATFVHWEKQPPLFKYPGKPHMERHPIDDPKSGGYRSHYVLLAPENNVTRKLAQTAYIPYTNFRWRNTFRELASGNPLPAENSRMFINLTVSRQFCVPEYLDVFSDANFNHLPLLLGLLNGITLAFQVVRLADEGRSGLKGILVLMGMSELVYFVAHFLSTFIISYFSTMAVITWKGYLNSVRTSQDMVSLFDGFSYSFTVFLIALFTAQWILTSLVGALTVETPSYAVLLTLLAWLGTMLIPLAMTDGLSTKFSQHIVVSRSSKLLTSINPVVALYRVFMIMRSIYAEKKYFGWSDLSRYAFGKDNVSAIEVITVQLLYCVGACFLIWYLNQILPWNRGVPRDKWFIFQKSYWQSRQKSKLVVEKRPSPRSTENSSVLQKTQGAYPALQVTNVSKKYDQMVALDDISFTCYENQITVLLGQSGAGKTTIMNIITETTFMDSGCVTVYRGEEDENDDRRHMSFCQQRSVVITDMTVWEHLIFFGMIRGTQFQHLKRDALHAAKTTRLTNHKDKLSRNLSGGMQRRLCVAIACLGDPKIIVLDEPSAGMDPESRQHLWDLLLGLRRRCCIVLSTHDMEEADTLADRVVIISRGKLGCNDTPLRLKKMFGTGYHVRIIKESEECDVVQVLQLIREVLPDAQIRSDSNYEVIVALGTLETRLMPKLFGALDSNRVALKIGSLGVTVTTLEDVFLKYLEMGGVSHEEIQSVILAEKKSIVRSSFSADPSVLDAQRTLVNMMRRTKPSLLQRLDGLAAKQFQIVLSLRSMFIASFFFVILIISGEANIERKIQDRLLQSSLHIKTYEGNGTEYSLDIFAKYARYPLKVFVRHDASMNIFVEKTLVPYLLQFQVTPVFIDPTQTMDEQIAIIQKKMTFDVFSYTYLFGVDLNGNISTWYNPVAFHMDLIAQNVMSNVILQNVTNSRKYQIETRYYTYTLTQDFTNSGIPQDVTDDVERIQRAPLLWIFFIPLVLSLVLPLFVLGPIVEKLSLTKELQLIADFVYKNRRSTEPLWSFGETGCGACVLAMCVVGTTSFLVLVMIESKGIVVRKLFKRAKNSTKNMSSAYRARTEETETSKDETDLDDDVKREAASVNAISNGQLFVNNSLTVVNLRKKFGSFVAVNNISFMVQPGECFGLLGVNGAGKTTTFQMITGFLEPDQGTVYAGPNSIAKSKREYYRYIGYCPQYNGLLLCLTGTQNIMLFGRLRGLDEAKLKPIANLLAKLFDMEKWITKRVEEYSGGNRRKLSVAVSLLGLPHLLLLDEPTAGIDILVRKTLLNFLNYVREETKMAIVFTSHAMDECEAACDRIAIMVAGKIECLGSLQHLKDRHGCGYMMFLRLDQSRASSDDYVASVTKALKNTFGKIQTRRQHLGTLEFRIVDQQWTWSELFEKAEQIREEFNLEDYLVSDTSLQQIFYNFAHQNPYNNLLSLNTSPLNSSPEQKSNFENSSSR